MQCPTAPRSLLRPRALVWTRTFLLALLVTAGIGVAAAPGAQAVPITGLVDTGAAGLGIDSNYAYSGAGTGPAVAVSVQSPAWVVAPAGSNWITPSIGAIGTHDYTLSFDLTGLDPSTASITGAWATDNTGEIFLNAASTGVVKPGGGAHLALASFAISSGFQSGINTLDFRVQDLGPPTGLLVSSLQGFAQVPEPSSGLLLALGLAGLVAKRRSAL